MQIFCNNLYSYLVAADRYSGWVCAYYFKPGEATASSLINIFCQLFLDYGVSEEVSSDGGQQFKAEDFNNFLKKWGVAHRKSSVDYPQSHGSAEVAVKTAKRILGENVGT